MSAKSIIAAGVIVIGTLVAAVPANAANLSIQIGNSGWNGHGYHQSHDRWDRGVSPREVRRILRHRGFNEIRFLDRQGRIYVARAEDRRGRDYRIIVSARNGAIIDIDRVGGRGRHDGHRGPRG